MSQTHPLALENISYLEQGLELLDDIDTELYTRTVPPIFSSGIGAHWRHCLDHYASFLDGWNTGTIDYAHRRREARIESDPAYAAERARAFIPGLHAVASAMGEGSVRVRVDCGTSRPETPPECASTVDRELQFLVCHTVHHYALIGMILKLEGHPTAADFGIAPSTLAHRRS